LVSAEIVLSIMGKLKAKRNFKGNKSKFRRYFARGSGRFLFTGEFAGKWGMVSWVFAGYQVFVLFLPFQYCGYIYIS